MTQVTPGGLTSARLVWYGYTTHRQPAYRPDLQERTMSSTTTPQSAYHASAIAVLQHLTSAYQVDEREITIHDPATSDWYGDGKTWVITGDLYVDDWAMVESVHEAAQSVPGVFAEPYDGYALCLFPA